MIGKLIIGVVIVAAIAFFIFGISNDTPIPSLITDKILPKSESDGNAVTPTTESPETPTTENPTPTTESPEAPEIIDEIRPVSLDQVDPQYVTNQTYVGQVYEKTDETCKVSVPGLAETINNKKELTHVLNLEECPYEYGDPVDVTKLEAKDNIPVPVISTDLITVEPLPVPPYYEVVQLKSSHKGNDVMLSYYDSSGNTIKVTVTLRNSVKEIFSGQFTSSKFEALVNDVPNTPHMIEMTIEHAVYGTLHASVYAPADSQDSTISGIFTKS